MGNKSTIKLQKNTHLAPIILVKYPKGTRNIDPKMTGIAKIMDSCPAEILMS